MSNSRWTIWKDKDGGKYDKMDYHKKKGFLESQAKKYNIDLSKYSEFGDESGARGNPTEDYGALQDAVTRESAKDYNYQRMVEAASLSGNKKAKEIAEMDEGLNRLAAMERFGEKTAKNKLGHGGDYSSESDYRAVKDFWVDRDRKKQDESYASADDLDEVRKQIEENAQNAQPVEAPELSNELRNTAEALDKYSLDLGTGGDQIFGAAGGDDLETARNENEANPAAGESFEYKDKYASNVKEGFKISGIDTRGPDSISAAADYYRRSV